MHSDADAHEVRIRARAHLVDDAGAVTVRDDLGVGHRRPQPALALLRVARVHAREGQPDAHLAGARHRVGTFAGAEYVGCGSLLVVQAARMLSHPSSAPAYVRVVGSVATPNRPRWSVVVPCQGPVRVREACHGPVGR